MATEIQTLLEELEVQNAIIVEESTTCETNKASAARLRKATSASEKIGKSLRKATIANDKA